MNTDGMRLTIHAPPHKEVDSHWAWRTLLLDPVSADLEQNKTTCKVSMLEDTLK